jgi:hypothetical protein
MTIVKRSKLYPVVILSCLALDFFWIGVLNSEFYTSQLGPLLRLNSLEISLREWLLSGSQLYRSIS